MTIHLYPDTETRRTGCCGKRSEELNRGDMFTLDPKKTTCQVPAVHEWPIDGNHLWEKKWFLKTARDGAQKPLQYRSCVHPDCNATQEREAPVG